MERALRWAVSWLWLASRSGFRAAARFCSPGPSAAPRPPLDRAVLRLEVVSFTAISCAHMYWLGWPRADITWLDDGILNGLLAGARTVATLTVCSVLALLLIAMVGGKHRRAGWRESRGPVEALAAVAGVAAGWWGFLAVGGQLGAIESSESLGGALLGLSATLLLMSGVLVLLGASAGVLWFGARHRMRITEGPSFLLPLGVLLTAGIALAEGVGHAVAEGLKPGYPVWVAVIAAFLAPCGAIVLAVQEFATLRSGDGVFAPRV